VFVFAYKQLAMSQPFFIRIRLRNPGSVNEDGARMEFPKLLAGQHAVLDVEVDTGIVLRLDHQRHLGAEEIWRVFQTFAEAQEFAKTEVAKHPTIECNIYDATQLLVTTVRNEEYVASAQIQRQKRWWPF
jgi:hypothetical protein